MKTVVLYLLFFVSLGLAAQNIEQNYVTKRFAVTDTIIIDSVSINPSKFILKTKSNTVIDTSLYHVNFAKAFLKFKTKIDTDSVTVSYLKYPKFLTKVYRQLNDAVIVDENAGFRQLYRLETSTPKNTLAPFDGLTTSGSISRGVTIGNNQNAVLNSALDLQISGKLSDKVSLRASIQDANIPLQESGYSQRLDEFDQVFIELYSDAWNIRAGDIDLSNSNSYFANFNKRVQGLKVSANLTENTTAFGSGAIVRGQFTTSQFTAQEGNQGPYKLRGANNALFVLIVSGSETVYVNGLPLQRGENNDYIIDYNAGEIIFNSTYPITSEMRITVDYQFTDRNYTRFTVFGGANYDTEKLKLNVSVYSESDAKNQPLQQNLSTAQTQVLANAGDDASLMFAPSETPETFSENRILYRKEVSGTEDIFVFSNNPEDNLFSVRFTLVGANQGNYVLLNNEAVSAIFEYIAPINGVPQGNYSPITKLIAPERLQVAVVNGNYKPTENTDVFFELAGSKNDINLFSSLNDDDNDGYAAKFKIRQQLITSDSLWNLSALVNTDFMQQNFRTIERLYQPEFSRDWNLEPITTNQGNLNNGNQFLLTTGLNLKHSKKGTVSYNLEYLDFVNSFKGNRHNFNANLVLGNFNIVSKSSFLTSKSNLNTSEFFRTFNRVVFNRKHSWAGVKLASEANIQNVIATDSLTNLSQKFNALETFVGIGDSTKVFTELGYIKRFNDSLRGNALARVNSSDTYYLKSRFIQNKNTQLQLFANYRVLKANDASAQDEESLNSRLNFNKKLFKNGVIWNTNFETNSGSLPQQDFTYVAVEAGQGAYTWIDYNENSIQELSEFEIAQFADQGSYIRVLLPNQVFVRTHQNRLSQTLTLNPNNWITDTSKIQKFLSSYHNQTSFLIDRKLKRNGTNFNLNPFETDESNQLALNNSFRNVLFYNRGKQNYTTSYTFLSTTNRNLLSIGFQENKLKTHQLNFNHKFATHFLADLQWNNSKDESTSENFTNRNFKINELRLFPKIAYVFNENAQFDVFYQFTQKSNTIGSLESLSQNNYGVSFTYNNAQKIALTGQFNFFQNEFEGNANTPVAYQILEGLQPGKNFTWSLIAQKKITKFLDLNLNYFGRKTETSKTIHTGTVQLKAYF